MKKWLYKAESKYGKYCIPSLMLVIIIGQAMVYIADSIVPAAGLIPILKLYWPNVMAGQVWRIFTFIFVPVSSSNIIFMVITLYFYYFLGSTLERTWGDFKFNVYYLCGVICAIIAAAIVGVGDNYYLNMSLFFAFAMLYPDTQVLFMFIIPVKIKYLAWIDAAFFLYSFIMGSMATRVVILFSLVNFLLFFGEDIYRNIKGYFKYAEARRRWKK